MRHLNWPAAKAGDLMTLFAGQSIRIDGTLLLREGKRLRYEEGKTVLQSGDVMIIPKLWRTVRFT